MTARNIFLIVTTGFFFVSSLALYSFVMSSISSLQQLLGWPIFMTSIILTTQFWGLCYKEFTSISFPQKLVLLMSVTLFLIAIVMLTLIRS